MKFQVSRVSVSGDTTEIKFTPVHEGNDDPAFRWNPSGEIDLITKNKELVEEFENGKSYTLSFSAEEAPKPAA